MTWVSLWTLTIESDVSSYGLNYSVIGYLVLVGFSSESKSYILLCCVDGKSRGFKIHSTPCPCYQNTSTSKYKCVMIAWRRWIGSPVFTQTSCYQIYAFAGEYSWITCPSIHPSVRVRLHNSCVDKPPAELFKYWPELCLCLRVPRVSSKQEEKFK